MKINILPSLVISLIVGFMLSASLAQTAKINYIDPLGYPDIKAGFTIEDTKGNQLRPAAYNWQAASDITVTENGVPRPIKAGWPFCADPSQKTFSAILVLDLSSSMYEGIDGTSNPPSGQAKWEIAFRAMQYFIGALDTNLTEVAIIEFGTIARIKMGYSNNKDSLMKSFTQIPSPLIMTNYNTAFIRNKITVNNNIVYDSTNSALYVAKFARYKPVIIFLTDGQHQPNNFDPDPFYVGVACNLAQQRNVRIFVVKIGSEPLNATSLNNLNLLAGVEGSPSVNLMMAVTNGDDLMGFYDKVLRICGQVGYPAPCEVVWESDCQNELTTRPVNIEFKPGAPYNYDLTTSSTFTIPLNLFPYLEITPNPIPFRNYTTKGTVTVTLRARNNYVKIPAGGFSTTDSRYKIIDWGGFTLPGILPKDSVITVKLEYSPTDSSYSKSLIEILGTACSGMDINTDGMMDLFCKNVDMGNCTVNDSVTATVTQLFCNRGPDSINVTGLNITTGDVSMFEKISSNPPIPCKIDTGQCLEVTFRFKPTSSGGKASRINLITDAGNFNSNIIGNGIGQPGIETASPIIFANTDCKTQVRDTVVYIKNTGPLPLTIVVDSTGLTGADTGEFKLLPPIPSTINASSIDSVTIRFKPNSAGTKTCFLHIVSNAGNSPDYSTRIEATADSINYEPNSYTVDLGTVCMTGIDTTITLTNVGTKVLHILTATKPSTMTLDKNSWVLNSGSIANIKINYKPFQDGPVDTVLIFTDDFCDKTKTIHFIGTVYDPKVANLNIIISSNVGVPYDMTFTITNPSASVGLTIIPPVTAQDPQFSFVSSIPPLPYTIPPGGTMQITVRYKPTSNQSVSTNLVLTGMPCHDVLIPMSGNPSLATVDIIIGHYSGLIGQVVPIQVNLQNANKFAESGTDTIDTKISFDSTLLQQDSSIYTETYNGNMRVLDIKKVPVQSTNANQTVLTLNLLVNGGGATTTPITITGTRSDKDNVVFNEINGQFDLIEASATLQTKNYEVYPGQVFDLVVWQSDAKNLSPSFHKGITTEVGANATLLEPVGLQSTIDTVGGVLDRITTLTGIPINNTPGEVQLKSFKFRAMLGNDTATNIILQNSKAVNGYIKFDTVVCRMTLLGICKDADGTIRLFDPKGQAGLKTVNPNPTTGITIVNFSLSEPGMTQLWVANFLGDKVLQIANDYMEPGTKQLGFDSGKLPDGVYFIIMQTPTQFFKQRFNVIK